MEPAPEPSPEPPHGPGPVPSPEPSLDVAAATIPDLSCAAAVGKTAGFRPPPSQVYIYIYIYIIGEPSAVIVRVELLCVTQ